MTPADAVLWDKVIRHAKGMLKALEEWVAAKKRGG